MQRFTLFGTRRPTPARVEKSAEMSYGANSEKTASRCVICLDEPPTATAPENARVFFECCGKPLCLECSVAYNKRLEENLETVGCPHCRSTQGNLYIMFDYGNIYAVTLCVDGTRVRIILSSRAIRMLKRVEVLVFAKYYDCGTAEFLEFEKNMRAANKVTLVNFIEQKALSNLVIKELIKGRTGSSKPPIWKMKGESLLEDCNESMYDSN